jgi:hypothetical protein
MITRQQVEAAIDFFIMLEKSSLGYDAMLQANAAKAEMHNKVVRQFGEEIRPATLENMQDVFYSFTNSNKYRESATSISIARSTLSENWQRINGWRD